MNLLLAKVLAGIGLLVALGLLDHHRIAAAEQRGFDKATSARAASDGVAALRRINADAAIVVKNDAINKFLTKEHDEKLAPVVASVTTQRLRIGPAICAGRSAAAAPAKAESTGGGDGADSASRLVQGQLERDIAALEIRVEQALAAGRTCQEFLIEQGMAP